MTDSRNQLFREYVRLLRELQPKTFVMENVSGMVKGKMKLIFAQILKELKGTGYRVSARLMDSMYFGVPQSRQRMIFIGVREGNPSHPIPATRPRSAGEAVEGVVNTTFNRPLASVATEIWNHVLPGQNGTFYRHNYYMNSIKLDSRKPAPTIPKIVSGTGGHMHWIERRSLTIEELKRIASYPDEFKMSGSFTQQYARIGNSVPPLFMRAIADHVKERLLASKG